ncbi:hypothetical protein Pcinc_002613 [Petrolisthes cinctipes]|uniref:Uncharacterized protein n=1 Tax=Petrolisthes cinctipes TaxID=88211 RepID=A0AAE1GHT5_PETCI|nr:hypothetical protein Pcinc_002613 [Petrolisthes cinctipes]
MAKSHQALESNQAGSSGGESLAEEQVCLDISGLFANQTSVSTNCKSPAVKPMVGRAAFITAQQGDETLQPWIEQARGPPEKLSPTTNYFFSRWRSVSSLVATTFSSGGCTLGFSYKASGPH